MLKRLAILIALAAPLGGCVATVEGALQIVDAATRIYNSVRAGVETTKIALSQECLAVSNLLTEVNQITDASSASCNIKQRVNKYAVRVSTYCNDLSKVNSSSLKSVLSTVQQAKAEAQAVVTAGCP